MIYKLDSKEYDRVQELIKSHLPELSVYSVIDGSMPGEIYVNDQEKPRSALIETPECNMLVGDATNSDFNAEVKKILDFWDQVTFDSEEWEKHIPEFHQNRFLRKYKRRDYALKELKYSDYQAKVPQGYQLGKIDPAQVSESQLENASDVLDWVANNWGSFENFNQNGAGFLIRNEDTIVSWSIADCISGKKMAIGVHTDDNYRRKGLGAIVVAAMVDYCLSNGIEEINWSCVDTNIGSIRIAEKVGFSKVQDYFSYTSYPPIENETDLSKDGWADWARYFEEMNQELPEFFFDASCCWAKANDVEGIINNLQQYSATGWKCSVDGLEQYDLFLRFKDNAKWNKFLRSLRDQWE